MMDVRHVYPLNDISEHVTDGSPCWCNPSLETVRHEGSQELMGTIVIHNAADGRQQMFDTRSAN